jgi:outer membrane protein assembly factor BamB
MSVPPWTGLPRQHAPAAASTRGLARRTALLAPLALLSGCGLLDLDSLFSATKKPLPGKREDVSTAASGLTVDGADLGPVTLPAAVANADWPQSGLNPAHLIGNLAGSAAQRAWSSSIGESGGYRRRITARPVVAEGLVFTMDPDAVVSAFDLRSGGRAWRTDTQGKKDRSTNVGGGIAYDGGTLYAATGRADVLGLDPRTGAIRWRNTIEAPARSAPTIAEGKLFLPTIEDKLLALSTKDGSRIWAYQATSAATSVLGQPAPAYADGLVVAGFGSGDLVAVRSDSGTVAWADSLGAGVATGGVADLSAIRGLPVIDSGRVYAIGLGGLMVCLDLRAGRRLWERGIASAETPCAAGDWVFVLTEDQRIAALHRDDGRARWVSDLQHYADLTKDTDEIFWCGPVLLDGRLAVGSSDRRLMLLDAHDGTTVVQMKLPGECSLAPVIAGNTLLVVTDDGTLTAMR